MELIEVVYLTVLFKDGFIKVEKDMKFQYMFGIVEDKGEGLRCGIVCNLEATCVTNPTTQKQA